MLLSAAERRQLCELRASQVCLPDVVAQLAENLGLIRSIVSRSLVSLLGKCPALPTAVLSRTAELGRYLLGHCCVPGKHMGGSVGD